MQLSLFFFVLATATFARPQRRTTWSLTQPGTTGVAAMQIVVVSETQILIVDKVQHNPLTINGHVAWSSIYSLTNNTVRPVDVQTNSFCASGNFLSNGTLVNIGGNLAIFTNGTTQYPQPIPNTNGLQGLRHFYVDQCTDSASQCAFYESPNRIRLTSWRWYPSSLRLQDGSVLVVGGSLTGAFMSNSSLDNPTMEFYPPKALNGFNGTAIPSPFLVDTLNANLFPITYLLPSGQVFIAANTMAMIYNWQTNTETRLPNIPNGVRVTYPMTGTGLLLPLRPSNNYEATVMICGGQARSDTAAPSSYSALDTASSQCASITLTTAGIAQGWIVETMPDARIMPDAVLLPTGKVLIANGGKSGYAGYGNVQNQVGASNAANPVYTPVLYDPNIALNASNPSARFSSVGLPTSSIARMYHSVATLTPNGEIWIAGSSPSLDVTNVTFATEYRAEILSPDYVSVTTRPIITSAPSIMAFNQSYTIQLQTAPPATSTVEVALMDFGFSTHSVHMDMRHVELVSSSVPVVGPVHIDSPPNGNIFPPGPGWLFVIVDGVPSKGVRVMVGTGASPPVDLGAWAHMLASTRNP
ncbi:glyoxal oxidase N-terminus-domain-containing protein [Auriculariales sp. MPI-PUGE-AT-0066]|nr:glyoxal oxidase N-terminus-domain-containing protein [Auriculariales sp. MPI-PUGE-AT-0066]